MRNLALLVLTIALFGCAGADSAAVDGPPDAFRRNWVSGGAPAWTAQFGKIKYGTLSGMRWIYMKGVGGECASDVIATETTLGDPTTGTFVASNSIAVTIVPGDPPCSMFDQTWTWALLSNGRLRLCGSLSVGPCVDFD
jgi:hypothetical protein